MISESYDDPEEYGGPGESGPGCLSHDRIVEAVIDLVDHNGLSRLTMRRLGKELGVEAMSLYRYVNGREDLLEGMTGYMVAQLHLRPEGGQLEPTDGWQVYLQWVAHGVRALARDHPNVFPLIATRHPAAPWLRPPLRSLRVVEDFLTMLISRGFSDDRANGLPHLLELSARASPARSQPAGRPDLAGRGAPGRGGVRRPQHRPEDRCPPVPARSTYVFGSSVSGHRKSRRGRFAWPMALR